MDTCDIAAEMRALFQELGITEEDLKKPHPEQLPGEILVGHLHQYRVGGDKLVKDYSSILAMVPYKSRRLGRGLKDGITPFGGFSWPVFANEEEVMFDLANRQN